MTEKTSPAGWVVQVTVLAPLETQKWIGPSIPSAPSFKYFNVAIGAADKAVEAVRERKDTAEGADVHAVRLLSATELATAKLKSGEVRPA